MKQIVCEFFLYQYINTFYITLPLVLVLLLLLVLTYYNYYIYRINFVHKKRLVMYFKTYLKL